VAPRTANRALPVDINKSMSVFRIASPEVKMLAIKILYPYGYCNAATFLWLCSLQQLAQKQLILKEYLTSTLKGEEQVER